MGSNSVQRKVLDSSVFKVGDDDDDNDNKKSNTFGKYTPKSLENSIDVMANVSSVEDASVYDYDGSYDSFKNKSTKVTSALLTGSNTSQQKQPQYINDLLKSAKVRELERERIFEKKIIKEQQMEGQQDETKFITSAYQKKLLESKKWEYEDNLADEIDKKTDVRSKGMEGFYKNLLTKNIALGSDIAISALSAYTSGSTRQQKLIEENQVDNVIDKYNVTFDKSIPESTIKTENCNKRLLYDTTLNMTNDKQLTKKIVIEEKGYENNNTSTSILPATNIDHDKKKDIILSAKERYLARKK